MKRLILIIFVALVILGVPSVLYLLLKWPFYFFLVLAVLGAAWVFYWVISNALGGDVETDTSENRYYQGEDAYEDEWDDDSEADDSED